jgi:hypothetical protein
MTKLLEEALAEVASLPEAAQEQIGRELIGRVERFHRLRDDIDEGIRSLDADLGRPFDIEDIIEEAHARHGRA